jgi:hypothetical protein
MSSLQAVSITCPNCRQRFPTQITTFVDADGSSEAKAMLVSGQLNIAVCPHCGHAGMLATPLLFHDADKEMLFTFVPSELGASEMDQQRLFGDQISRIISSLPAERRKAYLLQPRSFLRLEAMIEAILEADGITREMLEAQRARVALLERLLRAPAEDTRRTIAQENDQQIDYDFFQLLSLNLEMAQEGGQARALQQLMALRAELLQWTTQGKEIADREDAIRSLGEEVTREELLEKLVAAALADEAVKIETMVALARPVIDYLFYQQLAGRLETAEKQGQTAEAQKLRALRQTVLQQTAEMDVQVQQATDEAVQFLRLLVASDEPEAILRANADRLDGLFLNVLMASLEAAERSGQSESTKKLQRVREAVMQLVQESQPPEIQLINRLLAAEFPDESRAILRQNSDQLDERLLETMALVRENLVRRGQEDVADRLSQIEGQVRVLMAGL